MIRKLIIVSVCALLLGPACAWAQQETITLSLKDVPVAEALRAVQQQAPDLQYTLHEGVTGNVTVDLNQVSVPTAIRVIATDVGAAYRLDQGVYVVEPKPTPAERKLPDPLAPTYAAPLVPRIDAPPGPPTTTPLPTTGTDEVVVRPIKLKHADPADIAMIFGGTVVGSRMGQLGWGGGMGLGIGGYGGGQWGRYGGGRYGGYGGYGGGYGGYRGLGAPYGNQGGVGYGGRLGNFGFGGWNTGGRYGGYGGYGGGYGW